MRGTTQLTISFYSLLAFFLAQASLHNFTAAWTLFGCSQIVIGLRHVLEAIERK
jgi:hypothetical protein